MEEAAAEQGDGQMGITETFEEWKANKRVMWVEGKLNLPFPPSYPSARHVTVPATEEQKTGRWTASTAVCLSHGRHHSHQFSENKKNTKYFCQLYIV